jgi:hypothetical protein
MGEVGDEPVRVLDINNNIDPVWHDFIAQSHIITQPTVSGAGPNVVIKCSSDKFFQSTFTTTAVQSSFEISQPIGDSVDSLLLGLDSAGNNAILTADIISAFDVDSTNLPPLLGAVVTVLNSPIDNVLPKFRIDQSNGSKNGTWLIALDSTTLEVRSVLSSHERCQLV